ncbi:MAG: hypothetical protein IJT01_06835 [Selenomonadaceae bacterium]|nr:hypothetical protein [Selenomonadaceae bacterium]
MKTDKVNKEMAPSTIKSKLDVLKEYEWYLLENNCLPQKNMSIYNKYNTIRRNKNNPSVIRTELVHIENIKRQLEVMENENKLDELEQFFDENKRFPLSKDEEKRLFNLSQNFPGYKSATEAQKKRWKDMRDKLHDYMLDELLLYKEEKRQNCIEILQKDKEYKLWLKHINFEFSRGGLPPEQVKKYKKLNYKKAEHESVEVRSDKLLKQFEDFTEDNKYLPERKSNNDDERNLAISIEKYMSGRNKKYKFTDEQKDRVKKIKSRFKRNRRGVSGPELVFSIAIRELFKDKYMYFEENKSRRSYGVNCDFFMSIDDKEYAFFYDGARFHGDIDKDKGKTERLLKKGVAVFRVREAALKSLEIGNPLYHEYISSVKEKARKKIINAIAKVISLDDYTGKIEAIWSGILEEVNRQKYNNKTEAEIICKYIEKSYKNNKAPSDKKGTSLDEKRIYRRLKEYLQRSEMSKLGLLIIFCIDTVYAKNKRKTVSRLLKNYGINDDTINKLKVFLTNDE